MHHSTAPRARTLPYVCILALAVIALYGCKKKDATSPQDQEVSDTQAQAPPTAEELRSKATNLFGTIEPVQDLPKEQVALGERLYHDPNLSSDGTISCASCHKLDQGGVDGEPTSPGVGGKRGDVNSPTAFNSHLNFVQFWDGRADSLEQQAEGPIENPVEMANTLDNVIAYLKSEESYVEGFQKAFDDQEINTATVTKAIAQYERTLSTPNDRFDQWQEGDDNALNDQETKGLQAFLDLGCATCHNGPGLGGGSYQKMGLVQDYFGTLDRDLIEADNGRYNVTQKEDDRHKFKVPLLRNIDKTGPYMHDGSVNNLDDMVTLMATYQLGKTASEEDVDNIVAFLHTLTGDQPTVDIESLNLPPQREAAQE